MSYISEKINEVNLNKPVASCTINELLIIISHLGSQIPKTEKAELYPAKDFLTKDEAREYLGSISMVTLDRIIKENKTLVCRPTADRVCFFREDLKAYMLSTKTK